MKKSGSRTFACTKTAIRGLVLLALLAIFVSGAPHVAQGCPMCEVAVDGAKDQLGRGLNVSIGFLMSMPFLLVGSVGGWLFYMKRRERGRPSLLRVLRTQKEEVS
jgi:hypothetical protein